MKVELEDGCSATPYFLLQEGIGLRHTLSWAIAWISFQQPVTTRQFHLCLERCDGIVIEIFAAHRKREKLTKQLPEDLL